MQPDDTVFPITDPTDLFTVLDAWVKKQPDNLLYTFLGASGNILKQYTYQRFAQRVNTLTAAFQQQFPADNNKFILLTYQPGLEMIAALFACNKAGFIGVPTAPLSRTDFPAWQHRISHILSDTQARRLALCAQTADILEHQLQSTITDTDDAEARSFNQPFARQLTGLNRLVTTHIPDNRQEKNSPENIPHPETFFIQYTSGSTSAPKGVMVSHANLIANCTAVVDHPYPVAVSWLPQHHDMGLIGYYIDIMLSGGCTYGFAPTAFIRRPLLWFETISHYQATATSAPNFALELCLHERRVPKTALATLNLSSIRFLMIAAEPVKPETFNAFLQKFRTCGLSQQSLFVAYGLAEFTLAVSSYGRHFLWFDSQALANNHIRPIENDSPLPTTQLMSCGKPLTGTSVRLVNPKSKVPVESGRSGEIWLAGQSVTQGYYNKPALTPETFHNKLDGQHYLRTGDIGFMHEGELFICGRLKDMLILHGRNIYPQDIEAMLQDNCPQIRRGAVVAFQPEANAGIVVAAELTRKNDIPDGNELSHLLRTTLQVPLTKLVFLAPKSIPKTSSGKIRRSKTRELYEHGTLNIVEETGHYGGLKELDYLRERYQLNGEEDYTLFDAGVDSLDLVILLHWLQEQSAGETRTRIDSRLFGIITIHQLFQFAEALQHSPEMAIRQSTQWLQQAYHTRREDEQRWMQADRHYQAPDKLPQIIQSTHNEQHNILLTGATGFLGIFLLAELLTLTTATIHVIVRSDNTEQATRRLENIFFNTCGKQISRDTFAQRVTVICGDLAQPCLGLTDSAWAALTHNIDTVYHNGALVNYLLDYPRMRASNVEGTRRILDLAVTGKPKVVNYISTTFIFGWATKAVLSEQDNNPAMELLDFGYSQSKWVSEQLVLSAMEQGLSARIFRPALITPALDGRGSELDITTRLLAFMLKYGIGVDTQNQVSFMPVDITARNIVAITQQEDSIGKTFHVTRDQHETLPQITALLNRKTGIDFTYYSLQNFVPEVVKRCIPDDPLYPLLDFLVGSVDNIAAMEYKQYNNINYRKARDQSVSGQQDAALEQVVDGIITFLHQRGLLPRQEA